MLIPAIELETESEWEISVADGRRAKVPYVGPVRVAFGKRFCYVGALVLGDELLLGAVPMEDMDLLVSPTRREVVVDPASPNIPHARVKRAKSVGRNKPACQRLTRSSKHGVSRGHFRQIERDPINFRADPSELPETSVLADA